jgi:hypothetical protein
MPKKLCVLCGYGFLSAQASPSAPAAVSIIFSIFQFSRLITATFPSGYRRRTPGPAAQGSGRGPHRLGRREPPSSVICQRRLSEGGLHRHQQPFAIQRGRRAVSDGGQIDPDGDLVSRGVDHCQAGTPLVGGEDPASILRHRAIAAPSASAGASSSSVLIAEARRNKGKVIGGAFAAGSRGRIWRSQTS